MLLSLIASEALKIVAKKGLEAVVGKTAEDAYAQIKQKIIGLLGGDKSASEALAQYEQNPTEDTRDVLMAGLTEAMERAPQEAQKLETFVNDYSQKVQLHHSNHNVVTLIQQQTIIGIDPDKHADVIVSLKEVTRTLREKESENARLVEAKELSEHEKQRLLAELAEERGKNNFSKAIKDRLSQLDAVNDFAAAERLLKEEIAQKQQRELAETYYQLGGYAKLQLKYKDALTYYEKAMHLEIVNPLYPNEAGIMMCILGFYKKGIELYEIALLLERNIKGIENGNVAILHNNIGDAWKALGEYGKAREYHEKALGLHREIYGDKDLYVAIVYNNLGGTWDMQHDYRKAIECYNLALDIFIGLDNHGYPHIAACYNNIGKAWCSLGDFQKAIIFYNKSLSIDIAVNGLNHPDVAIDYNNLGGAWYELGELEQALDFFYKALTIDTIIYGDSHPKIAFLYNNLGGVWRAKGDYQKTLEYCEKALYIDKNTFGELHPNVAVRYNNLAGAWYDLKNMENAIYNFEKALNILETMYPDGQDRYTKQCRANLTYMHSLKK